MSVPALRVFGMGCVTACLLLYGGVSTWLIIFLTIYGPLCWWILRQYYSPIGWQSRLPLAFYLLDVPVFTMVVYQTGAEKSWFIIILLSRIADQANTTFKKVLLFAHWVAFCFFLMLVVRATVSAAHLHWGVELSKTLLLYLWGVYVAFTAKTAEQLRERARRAREETDKVVESLALKNQELKSFIDSIHNFAQEIAATSSASSARAGVHEKTVAAHAETAAQVLESADDITQAALRATRATEEVGHRAREFARMMWQRRENLQGIGDALAIIETEASKTSERLTDLRPEVKEIRRCLQRIQKTSDHTNIISLNAQIEAERSTSDGNGFSVVASEIRRLADLSFETTTEITDQVVKMERRIESSVEAMENLVMAIENNASAILLLVDEIGPALESFSLVDTSISELEQVTQEQRETASSICSLIARLEENAQTVLQGMQEAVSSVGNVEQHVYALEKKVSQRASDGDSAA